jgi:hypothetical protein
MKKHADMLTTPLGGAALGLGLGVGARGVKHLFQMFRNQQNRSPAKLSPDATPITEYPVEVSDEEAKALTAKGIQVKTAEGFIPNLLGGAALAGGTYAGWKGLSHILGQRKKQVAEQRLLASRKRVESLLDGEPAPADQPLGTAMKVAEDAHFSKTAFNPVGAFFGGAANYAGTLTASLAWPLGAAGFLLGARAFRRTTDENKNEKIIKALQRVSTGRPTDTPTVAMVPVRKRKLSAPPASQTVEQPPAESGAPPKDADVLAVR